MNFKNILKSKTFWVNAVTAVAAATQLIPPQHAQEALIVSTLANIVLRKLTTTQVTILPK